MTRRLPLPTYSVTISRHVCVRYLVPAQKLTLVAFSEADARLAGIRRTHVELGLPAWKPLIRESWPHSSATPTTAVPRVSVPAPHEQLRLAA